MYQRNQTAGWGEARNLLRWKEEKMYRVGKWRGVSPI